MAVWRESISNFITDTVSKKFVIFVAATILLVMGKITEMTWLYVALGYMSVNFLERITEVIRK